jgi:hypothetical protein
METLLTHAFVRHYLAELKVVTMPAPPDNRVIPQENPVPKWIPPQELMKGNADDAVARNNGPGAVAEIFRDKDRRYLGSSAVLFLGVTDRPSLEPDDRSVSLEDHSGK